MAKYISNRQQNLKIGIVSYTEDKTVLEVTGNVGIKTADTQGYELYVNGDANISGIVSASSFRGDGSQLTGVTTTSSLLISANTDNQSQYLTYVTGTGSTTGFGITTTGLVFNPSTGNLGIGTTNPTSKLHVVGNVYVSGIATLTQISAGGTVGTAGSILSSTGSGLSWIPAAPAGGITVRDSNNTIVGTSGSVTQLTFSTGFGVTGTTGVAGIATITLSSNIVGTSLSISGISTFSGITTHTAPLFGTVASFSGVVTALSFSGNASSATFATNAGIATNLKGGVIGNIPYQSATDTTAFLTNGGSGTILQSNGVGNAPTWVAAAPAGAVSGLVIRDSNNTIIGSSGSVTQLTFSTGFGVTGTTGVAGIATITLSSNIVGTSLSISGITTLGVTSTTNLTSQTLNVSGISTFTNGPILVGTATSTGTASQRLQVTGGAYVSGSVGIGTTNPQDKLEINSLNDADVKLRLANSASSFNNFSIIRSVRVSDSQSKLEFQVNNAGIQTCLIVDYGGIVYIGQQSSTKLIVTGNSKDQPNFFSLPGSLLNVYSNTALAADTGGSITLGGVIDASSATKAFGVIKGYKENATASDAKGYLSFLTNTGSSISEALRITSAGNLLIGTATSTGTASQKLQVDGGAYVSGNLGIGTINPTVALQLSPTASISNLNGNTNFGTTAGAAATVAQFYHLNGNASYLRIKATRNTDGSNWTTASTKLVQVIDVTEMGYIEYNPNGANYGMAFGQGGSEWARFLSGGNLGIGTTNPTSKLHVVGNVLVSGIITSSGGIKVDESLTTKDLNVIGIATIATLGVSGLTTTKDLNVIGIGTIGNVKISSNTVATSSGNLTIDSTGGTTTIDDILSVTGNVTLGNDVNSNTVSFGATVSSHIIPSANTHNLGSETLKWGTVYATQFSTGASGTGVNITTDTISGPAILTIDPAAVGDDTGAVRIKGDLYVDGTQFIVNSTTIELADFNVGIATTVGTNDLLDGAGIGIGSTSIRKTLTWSNGSTALKSSEDFDVASGKVYKVNGTSVLSSDTLGSGIVNSSLTSVGTLGSLSVGNVYSTGISTLGVTSTTNLTSQTLNVSGISTLGVTSATNLTSQTLVVSGISTLGVTSTTNLTSQQLNVSGVSTLGTVKISSGIVTATTGIITYFGDGSNLTGLSAGVSISTSAATQSQFLTFVAGTGTTTGFGVSTTGLVFNPSTGNLGIGTTNPLQKAHILGGLLVSAGSSTTQHITQKAYELNSGTLSWEGSAGQLFSITNNLTLGSIFSVNDVSGIPSIDVDANGTVSMVSYGGSVGIGTTLATQKLHVQGNVRIAGALYDVNNNVGTAGSVLSSTGSGVSWIAAGSGGGGISSVSISTSAATQSQFLTFVAGTGTTTGFGVSTTGLVFNPSTGNLGIGTTNPQYSLQVQGNARITGALRDSTNSPGTSGQVLQSTVTGTQWAAAGGGSGKFDTTIDNVLYFQPTGTLDIIGVGQTTTQITTLPSGTTKYLVHSLHVTNVSNGDAEITAGFIMNARKVPATISVSIGQSGGAGIHTFTVGSASSITVGMAVTGTGNIGETTGIGSTAGFQFNTYVTSVNGTSITLSKPMSGRATGTLFFSPVSLVSSRLPVPVGSAVELLKQPMVLNALDSIVLQSTGAGSGIGSTSTAAITQAANSNFLTVTAGAAITNFLASGMLIQPTGSNTGIQTNTFVGVGYTPGTLSIPMTKPATVALASTSLSFTEVITPQDGALQVTVVYQSSTDTSYQNGTGTVVGIVTLASLATSPLLGITSTTPSAYYGTGIVYPSIIQSIRVSNISDSIIYPGGDYSVSVGIGNSDTIFSYLAYNMVIPRNSSIELCESPKIIGIGQSIFAFSNTPNAIEIQIAGKRKTT